MYYTIIYVTCDNEIIFKDFESQVDFMTLISACRDFAKKGHKMSIKKTILKIKRD